MATPRLLVLSAVLASCAFAHAQETLTTASVTGRVLDPTGAAVPQATVIAQELATNQTHTVMADRQGRFRIPFLPVGSYRFTTHPTGFAETARVVQLTVGASFDVTLTVAVGSTATSINVNSSDGHHDRPYR